jgi:hypothetical protein
MLKINFIVAIFILTLLPSAAKAQDTCGCLSYIPNNASLSQKVKHERKRSKAVFTGEVLQIDKLQSGFFQGNLSVTFKVKESWKRVKGRTVSVITSPSAANCGYNFQVGESYLVYVEYLSGENMLTSFCSRTRRILDAVEDLNVLGKGKIIREGK